MFDGSSYCLIELVKTMTRIQKQNSVHHLPLCKLDLKDYASASYSELDNDNMYLGDGCSLKLDGIVRWDDRLGRGSVCWLLSSSERENSYFFKCTVISAVVDCLSRSA